MRDRVRNALATRHRPAKGEPGILTGQVRLLSAQLAAVRDSATVVDVRAAADVPAAVDVIDAAIEDAVVL